VGHLAQRTSRQAPPPWRISEALIDEIGSWWIPVEGECLPVVVAATRPNEVRWSSPFTRWPDDTVLFRLASTSGPGTALELHHEGNGTLQPMDQAALRHRWGQHLDMDLREFVDDGWPTDGYRFTPYRVDLEDWSVSDRIHEEQQWLVTEDLWASIAPNPERGWLHRECVLPAGSLLWVVGRRYHRMAVRCVALEPPDLEDRLIPRDLRHYERGNAEILVPVAEFERNLHLANGR
jgi:hypothetical protein